MVFPIDKLLGKTMTNSLNQKKKEWIIYRLPVSKQ